MSADPSPPIARSSSEGRWVSRASRRREKPQLSCNICRQRKLRCDRAQPSCSGCVSRGLGCTYPANYANTLLAQAPVTSGVLDRLRQLEQLVTSLAPSAGDRDGGTEVKTSNHPSSVVSSASAGDQHSEPGSMRISTSEVHYVNAEHWTTILDSIADIKNSLGNQSGGSPMEVTNQIADDAGEVDTLSDQRRPHALLLYDCVRPESRAEILAAVPAKGAVERLIARYFNHVDLVSATVHGPTFIQEYERLWADPYSVPIMWIGLLFGMMCMATLSSDRSDVEAHADVARQSQIELFREKTVQCLLLGEYTRGGLHAMEAVLHYVYIEFATRTDADVDIWYLHALQVNLALRMGHHRDPKHFARMSPLQAEIRRRIWATILLADVLISSQMGMPRMLSDGLYDTSEPRNLSDGDLDATMQTLPPGRPETEVTAALGVIARRRVVMAVGAASDLVGAIQPANHDDVMRMDGILDEAAANIPPPLKPKTMATSVTDAPQLIMNRLFISQLFYKGKIKLHQRFLSTPPDGENYLYAHSQRACVDACLGLLHIQEVLDEEIGAGGQLHMMRWRVSSIVNHQFLTATMILCLSLHRNRIPDADQTRNVIIALKRSRQVWLRNSHVSNEAREAANTITRVLANVEGNDMLRDDETSVQDSATLGPTMQMDQPFAPYMDLNPMSGEALQDPLDMYIERNLWNFGLDGDLL